MAYFDCQIVQGSEATGPTLTVTCDSGFAGAVVTCTDGITTLTSQCPSSSPYKVVFTLPIGSTGIWTVSSGSRSTSINIDLSAELHTIPTGSSVTPINDIQTWLHCADIWDKDYTTMNQVLGDTSILLTLINNNNAVDYMVRSTGWIVTNDILVPELTANTSAVIKSSEYSGEPAYHVFDRNSQTQWSAAASNTNPAYIGYDFSTSVKVKKIHVLHAGIVMGVLQYSDDKSTWTDTDITYSFSSGGEGDFFTTNDYGSHRYWRIYLASSTNSYKTMMLFNMYSKLDSELGILSNITAISYIAASSYCKATLLNNTSWRTALANSDYITIILPLRIPTMTSNTVPSGVASANSQYSGYPPFQAFNGINDNTGWCSLGAVGDWIQYQFADSGIIANVLKIYRYYNSASGTIVLKGSNNGSSWTNLQTCVMSKGYAWMIFSFANSTKYKYYRFEYITTGGNGGNGIDIELLGRSS